MSPTRQNCVCGLWELLAGRYAQALVIMRDPPDVEFLVYRAKNTIDFAEDLARDCFELEELLAAVKEMVEAPANFPP